VRNEHFKFSQGSVETLFR